MTALFALAAFSFVSAVTPGPNNVMLWGSGIQFGLRKTLPHVIGIALGVGSMALVVGSGLGVLITTVPAVEVGLKVIGSIYLLYLAYRIAGGGGVTRGEVAEPLRVSQAIAFQYVNPKAWVFVLAAMTAFLPAGVTPWAATPLMATVMALVVVPCAALWAGAGTFLSGFMGGRRSSRVFRIVLGLLLAATVAYIWI